MSGNAKAYPRKRDFGDYIPNGWDTVIYHADCNDGHCAGLSSYPRTFEMWDELWFGGVQPLIAAGEPILRYQQGVISAKQNANVISFVEIAGHVVPCVNTTTLVSEIVGGLADKFNRPFAAGFFILPNGNVQYSLRGRKTGMFRGKEIDLSKIAKRYGGGGHKNSAGFTLQTMLPMFPNGLPSGVGQ